MWRGEIFVQIARSVIIADKVPKTKAETELRRVVNPKYSPQSLVLFPNRCETHSVNCIVGRFDMDGAFYKGRNMGGRDTALTPDVVYQN